MGQGSLSEQSSFQNKKVGVGIVKQRVAHGRRRRSRDVDMTEQTAEATGKYIRRMQKKEKN